MKTAITILLLVLTYVCYAQPQHYTVANAHSHNDYEQPTPFWTAYNEGFGSIEADIYLHHDSLLVAHEPDELSLHRTLEQYYLEPLAECIKKNRGYVFSDKKKQLQLLIDVKTDAVPTLNKLIETLRKYPSLINAHSITFVISGNRPDESQLNSYPSFISFDGVLSKEYTPLTLKRITLLSDNIVNYVRGNVITNEEWQQLQLIIHRAHKLKKPVRFWGTPDTMDVWKQLLTLKVDYINTDHINALGAFLRGDTKVNSE